MKNNLKSRDQNLVVQELENETLIYDLTANKAYCLNQTAAFVWKSLDGETDVKAIAANLAAKTKCAVDEEIVWLAIEQLKKDNLLANADDSPNHFEGINRREVVKRIGLATMIALPVVTSMVAPKAANASSTPSTCNYVAGQCYNNTTPARQRCGPQGCPPGTTLRYQVFLTTDCAGQPIQNLGGTCDNSNTPIFISGTSFRVTTFTPAP